MKHFVRFNVDLCTFVTNFCCRDLRTFSAEFLRLNKRNPQTESLLECTIECKYLHFLGILGVVVWFLSFLGLEFSIQKSCPCKRNDKYQVWRHVEDIWKIVKWCQVWPKDIVNPSTNLAHCQSVGIPHYLGFYILFFIGIPWDKLQW